jgi:iron complex outermembrane recepter protein
MFSDRKTRTFGYAAVRRLCRALVLVWLMGSVTAQERDLSSLDLEDLVNIKVTSVSKKEQRLLDTPAAIYVITQEDIRHSGMTSIPELLRLVPGVNVAQIDGNIWAITARGYNGEFANKLLVLIDGRSVYTPLYSGVYWEVQDLLLEDIDRIEVIRGPGAAVWGANAVNGVINILTKRASDTPCGLFTTGFSTAEQRFGGFRYGDRLAHVGDFRLFAKYSKRDGLAYPTGQRSVDGMEVYRGGFRVDSQLGNNDSLTWQGDTYQGTVGQHVDLPGLDPLVYSANEVVDIAGGNLLTRWSHRYSTGSDFLLQAYLDTTRRSELLIGQRVTTFDLQFQQRHPLGGRQEVVWGLGYRRTADRLRNTATAQFTPDREQTNLFSGFVEDEIALVPQRLWITAGSKFEHNDYTGAEVQPMLRLSYAATARHHFWAAASRAVRTPSRAERDVRVTLSSMTLPTGGTVLVALFGNRQLVAEKLWAYEAGYRWQSGLRASLDVATFYNRYKSIESVAVQAPFLETVPSPAHLLVPVQNVNLGGSTTMGTEAVLKFKINEFWRLSSGYSWLEVRDERGSSSLGQQFTFESPRHQYNLGSSFYLPRGFTFDMNTFYVGGLARQQVPSYVRLDMHLGWNATEKLRLSVGAQNLLEPQHPEYRLVYLVRATEVRRSAYLQVSWAF